ncbi:MAG TPA: hypothetical protein VLI71_14895, partial [Gammaproteobacteria bacterium]|nr:hypothetical protein [Gammaproteobacteria bacterium]
MPRNLEKLAARARTPQATCANWRCKKSVRRTKVSGYQSSSSPGLAKVRGDVAAKLNTEAPQEQKPQLSIQQVGCGRGA